MTRTPQYAVCEPHAPGEIRKLSERSALGKADARAGVRLACGDDAARLRDAAHLVECAHRVRDVLEHLVGLRDVEGGVREGEHVRVAHDEIDVRHAAFGGMGAGLVEGIGDVFHACDVTLRHVCGGEVDGDGAGATAYVENL